MALMKINTKRIFGNIRFHKSDDNDVFVISKFPENKARHDYSQFCKQGYPDVVWQCNATI